MISCSHVIPCLFLYSNKEIPVILICDNCHNIFAPIALKSFPPAQKKTNLSAILFVARNPSPTRYLMVRYMRKSHFMHDYKPHMPNATHMKNVFKARGFIYHDVKEKSKGQGLRKLSPTLTHLLMSYQMMNATCPSFWRFSAAVAYVC